MIFRIEHLHTALSLVEVSASDAGSYALPFWMVYKLTQRDYVNLFSVLTDVVACRPESNQYVHSYRCNCTYRRTWYTTNMHNTHIYTHTSSHSCTCPHFIAISSSAVSISRYVNANQQFLIEVKPGNYIS